MDGRGLAAEVEESDGYDADIDGEFELLAWVSFEVASYDTPFSRLYIRGK